MPEWFCIFGLLVMGGFVFWYTFGDFVRQDVTETKSGVADPARLVNHPLIRGTSQTATQNRIATRSERASATRSADDSLPSVSSERLQQDGTRSRTKGNNGVGNGEDPQPPGDPPVNDGPGTGPGNPGNRGGAHQ